MKTVKCTRPSRRGTCGKVRKPAREGRLSAESTEKNLRTAEALWRGGKVEGKEKTFPSFQRRKRRILGGDALKGKLLGGKQNKKRGGEEIHVRSSSSWRPPSS